MNSEEALNQEQIQWVEQPCQQQQADAGGEIVADDVDAAIDAVADEQDFEDRSFAIPSMLLKDQHDEVDGDVDATGAEGEGDGENAAAPTLSEEESALKDWFAEQVKNPSEAPEWLRQMEIQTKVNGKPAGATFQDLINSYQTQEAATQRLDEAKSKAQSLHQEMTQKLEASTTELATASALTKLVEETVLRQELEQLQRLKEEHGAGSDEYHAAKENLTTRAQTLARAKQKISQKLKHALEQRNAEPSDEEYATAQQKLFELHPELEDEGKRTELVQFALGLGFTQEQLGRETNPLLFSLAWRALQHDQTKAKADAAKKKITTIPRIMKPSAQNQQAKRDEKWDPVQALYGTK